MRRFATILLLAFPATLAMAEMPEEVFARGNAAYEQGRYAEAADAYRTLLKYRIRDARVEYNLGNAEFRLGNLGTAILHFERARRMDPTDRDVRDNLDYARTFCFDRVEPVDVPALLSWLHGLQDRLGPDRQFVVVLVLLWITAALLAWSLARPGRWNVRYGWSLAGLLLLLVLGFSSWWVTHRRLDGQRLGVVLVEAAEVLAGPGANNPALFTVHEGLTIEVRDLREEWVQVSLPNGLHGWLPRSIVGLV